MLLFSKANATDYYVRPAGANYGFGNGTSYKNAWAGFSNINWTIVDNGNGVLWVDGTHNETLTIGANGESGFPIYVKNYSTSVSVRGVNANNRSYVTVDGLTVENNSGDGVSLHSSTNAIIKNCIVQGNTRNGITSGDIATVATVVIDNCIIRNNGSAAAINNGIFFNGATLTVKNCTIINNGYGDPQVDKSHGIYMNASVTTPAEIYGNTVYSNRAHGIQVKGSANIYNNIVYNNPLQGIHGGENGTSNIVQNIHNNLIYSNGDSAIAIYSKGSGTYDLNIYNNSTYKNGTAGTRSGWYTEILVSNAMTSLNIMYNILYASTDDLTINIGAEQSHATIDYNVHYGPSGGTGNPVRYLDVSRTWSYWTITLGRDTHGYNADPKYSNPPSDMTLLSSSPGLSINAGANAFIGALPPTNRIPEPPIIKGVY